MRTNPTPAPPSAATPYQPQSFIGGTPGHADKGVR